MSRQTTATAVAAAAALFWHDVDQNGVVLNSQHVKILPRSGLTPMNSVEQDQHRIPPTLSHPFALKYLSLVMYIHCLGCTLALHSSSFLRWVSQQDALSITSMCCMSYIFHSIFCRHVIRVYELLHGGKLMRNVTGFVIYVLRNSLCRYAVFDAVFAVQWLTGSPIG